MERELRFNFKYLNEGEGTVKGMLAEFRSRERKESEAFLSLKHKLNQTHLTGTNRKTSKSRKNSNSKSSKSKRVTQICTRIQRKLESRSPHVVVRENSGKSSCKKQRGRVKIAKKKCIVSSRTAKVFDFVSDKRKGYIQKPRKNLYFNSEEKYMRFSLTSKFIRLKEEFKMIASVFKSICCDQNRVKNPLLPQNNYVSLKQFKLVYEKRFDRIFSFIVLGRILKIWDGFMKVQMTDKQLNADLENYYINISGCDLKDADIDRLAVSFNTKLMNYIKCHHDKYIFENRLKFNYCSSNDWVIGFCLNKVYDSLHYRFETVKDCKELIKLNPSLNKASLKKDVIGNKTKIELLRKKIVDKMKNKQKEELNPKTPSKKKDLKLEMLVDIAEKVYYVYKIKNVKSIFLIELVSYLKKKVNLNFFQDIVEINCCLKRLTSLFPEWICFVDYRGKDIIRINKEIGLSHILKRVRIGYKTDN